MRTTKIIVKQENGIHIRVADAIAKAVRKLSSKITFKKGGQTADGDSVLQLLMLSAGKGAEIEVTASGGNEEESLIKLEEIFSDGGGI
ncbi:MAG TPA: HPr family phosphocarrier protein [Chitinivibrionales bacterium]|nr:HPr family phosphocarrier protein [Chitinivibrionales bacterium]